MSIFDYILAVLPGLPVSLSLTFTRDRRFCCQCCLPVLSLKPGSDAAGQRVYHPVCGTPLLVSFPDLFRAAQFEGLKNYPLLWELMSSRGSVPW